MIDLKKEELESILEILKSLGPKYEIRIFGSRCKGSAKKFSDLDIAIVGDEKLEIKTIASLKDEFEESNLPFRVDILDWNSISPEFKKIIEQGYEVLDLLKPFQLRI